MTKRNRMYPQESRKNQITKDVKILGDEPDNRILECAVCGNAGIIVTGDKEMLNLGKYEKVRIITLKEYLIL
ncbi:MAG: hypothetical protein M1508_14720 [Nitrospirae bacterium]|nr:hypothetical protein [Nitrospirota bacterium]